MIAMQWERAVNEDIAHIQALFSNLNCPYDTQNLPADIRSRRVWKLCQNDDFIGAVVVHIEQYDGFIDGFALSSAFQNQNIGSEALARLEDMYRVRCWRVFCPTHNTHFAHFLQKNSYIKAQTENGCDQYEKPMYASAPIQNGGNLYRNLPELGWQDEFFETLQCYKNVRMERIVSRGQTSPASGFYDQEHMEIVFVLEGSARLEIDGIIHYLKPGDWRILAPHLKHRVVYTSREPACIWLAIHIDETPATNEMHDTN